MLLPSLRATSIALIWGLSYFFAILTKSPSNSERAFAIFPQYFEAIALNAALSDLTRAFISIHASIAVPINLRTASAGRTIRIGNQFVLF
jgi:hypothetical protein